jgi:RNA polymerase sigma-70 factor (ECF subfamily)
MGVRDQPVTLMDDDEALIAAAVKGSAFAWEKLVKRYESRLYNHGLRLMGNPTDAMDLMQEVFLGVYRNLHRFRGDAKFSSWLFRIAHNKAIDLNRRKRLMTAQPKAGQDDFDVLDTIADESGLEPDRIRGQDELNARVIELLSRLPLDQRLVVELKIYQSLTFEEIAEMQEISTNTAKTRFYAALKKLRAGSEDAYALSQD